MHGPTGTGKTHLAAAAANGLIAARIPVIFTTFPQLLGMVTSNHFERTEPVIQALQNITVLILDDVRNDNLKSSWACSVLFRVLDHRYVTQSPTMVVSNHPLSNTDPTKAFTTLQQFEPRIASRLGDKSISHVIAVIAKDQRAV
jgi:DNA replication protein DnaC